MTPDQTFEVEKIDTLEKLRDVWPFLLSGLAELNGTLKRNEVTPDEFFMRHADIATSQVVGIIFKINSKNGKPLAYVTGMESSPKYKPGRWLWVYAIYSNRLAARASRYASEVLEKWARENGFTQMHCHLGRTSGSAIQWAKRFHGFELEKLYMVKKLV